MPFFYTRKEKRMSTKNISPEILSGLINADITVEGFVLRIRKASGISLVSLKNGRYIYQAVYIPDLCKTSISQMCEGAYIECSVSVKEEKRAPYGFELTLKDFVVISKPLEEYPLNVSQPTLGCTLDESIRHRTVALKHPTERATMQIRSVAEFAFCEYMQQNQYIQIHTPKITSLISDKDYINLRYFDRDATLTASPALHKIMAVGGFDRVYEVGAGYSPKNKNSIRHLNEFTRLDFELAYADAKSAKETLTGIIRHITKAVTSQCAPELELLGITLATQESIPEITYDDAIILLDKDKTQLDLDPTDEKKLCEYSQTKFDSDYIYVTNLPSEKRPFYEKENGGFALLSNGIEVASGGEHISDYEEQLERLETFNYNIADYEPFLSAHKYALPPISGAGIGLERFIMALLKLDNIRKATLFPRDLHHLTP